jgi:hypothetical protein
MQSARTPSSAPPPSTTSMSASSALLLPRRTAAPRRTALRSVCAYHSKSEAPSRGSLYPHLLTCSCSLPPHSLRDRVRRSQAVAHSEINPQALLTILRTARSHSITAGVGVSPRNMQDCACKRLAYRLMWGDGYLLPTYDRRRERGAGWIVTCLFCCEGWERWGLAHRAPGNVSIGEAQLLRGSHANKNQRSPVYN